MTSASATITTIAIKAETTRDLLMKTEMRLPYIGPSSHALVASGVRTDSVRDPNRIIAPSNDGSDQCSGSNQ